MADNDNNLPVAIDGGDQAVIGTDVYSSSGQTAHAQVMKVAWGNDSTVTRATTATPLPVQIYGITGSLATMTVTGSVSGLGSFNVANTAGSAIHVTGGARAFVYGVTGAPPVAVTGGVSILGNVGITGMVNVTGGRFLNSSTDSIQVTGSVNRGWVLNNVNDGVRIWGHNGQTLIPSAIYSGTGVAIGASGDALNVNIIGAGISANVSIGSSVGVYVTGDALRIQGTAGGTPIPISGNVGFDLENNTVKIDNTQPIIIDLKPPYTNVPGGSYNGSGFSVPDLAGLNGLEKLLISKNGPNYHTVPTWLKYIWDVVGVQQFAYTPSPSTISNKLSNMLRPEGDGIYATTTNRTKVPIQTWVVGVSGLLPIQLDPTSKSGMARHGVTIRNSGDSVQIGAGTVSSGIATAPTNDNDYGIVLNSTESIFIPAVIDNSSNSPLFAKVASGEARLTLMAV